MGKSSPRLEGFPGPNRSKLNRLAALLFLVIGSAAVFPAAEPEPAAWWAFDETREGTTLDLVREIRDRVFGPARIVQGVRGAALLLDGYTTHVRRDPESVPRLSDAFALEAWVALQAYPWNRAAILDLAGAPLPRPQSALPEPNLNDLQPGLVGAVYGEPDLTDPQSKVIQAGLDSDWTGGAQTWSARWRGYLEAPHSGPVHFEAEVDDGLQLLIGGRLVVDAWQQGGNRTGTFVMEEGEHYPVLLLYTNDHGPSFLRLFWSWEGSPRVVVPPLALSHSARDEILARNEIVPPREGPPDSEIRVFFGIDAEGRLVLAAMLDGRLRECVSSRKLPLLRWTHVAGVLDPDTGLSIYVDGIPAGRLAATGRLQPDRVGAILIGKSHRSMGAAFSERKPSGDWLSAMVLDGSIDEVKLYDRALTDRQIASAFSRVDASSLEPLAHPVLPSGPGLLPPRFDAAYARLRYTAQWEEPWRVAEHPDILIRFDRLPYRIVFWRGTNYGAALVAENGLWMGDQSLERSGGTRYGTAEHMNDKQTRFSSVRILEDHEARKVIHWRYALTDIAYEISRLNENGWGEWGDEYYQVYPDGVSTRHQILHTDDLRHEWQETIVINPPGTRPEDNLEIGALTLANLAGESRTYSWEKGPPESFDEPAGANLQMTNLKSMFRPFIIFEPEPRIKPFRAAVRLDWSHFPWWNHWPVAKLANDGRRVGGPGRASHSSLSQSIEDSQVIHARGDGSYEAVTLIGMTDQPIQALLPLARSWLAPPELLLSTPGAESRGYDRFQRAYVLDVSDEEVPARLEWTLAGSEGSPVVNPAFLIRGWGERAASLRLDGRAIPRGPIFRQGFEHTLQGTNLVVWVEAESLEPVRVVLEARGEAQ